MTDDKCLVEIDKSFAVPIIRLKGEITSFSDENINEAFTSTASGDSMRIVLDFSSINYINSAGIAILVNLVTETKKMRGKLYFSGLVAHYRRVMEIVGITEYVDLFDSAEQALVKAVE